LTWRALKADSSEPLQTNFLQSGEDDEIVIDTGAPLTTKRENECRLETRPSINEMLKAMKGVVFETRTFRRSNRTTEVRSVPVGGDIGYGTERNSTAFTGAKMKSVVRLGRLHFSDADGHALSPRGALLYQSEEAGQPHGLSNTFFPPPESRRFNQEEYLVFRQDLAFANDNTSPEHAAILDATIRARNFAEVGEKFGFKGKTAERQGKRLVQEAAKGFSETLKRLAA